MKQPAGNHQIQMRSLPSSLESDPDRLIFLLTEMLDDNDLEVIAKADYGVDFDAHLAALRNIVRHGVTGPLAWVPREVLELVRWDEPPHGEEGYPRHRRRAFACAALLRAMGESDSPDSDGAAADLAILIDGIEALRAFGPSREHRTFARAGDEATAAFLVWLVAQLAPREDPELPYLGLGLLWCMLGTDATDDDVLAVAEWTMVAEAAQARSGVGVSCGASEPWLFGSSSNSMRPRLWRRIGRELPARMEPRHGTEVVDTIRLISAMLDG